MGTTLFLAALMLASTVVVSRAIASGSVQVDVAPVNSVVNTDGADSDGSTGEPDAGQTKQPPQIGVVPTHSQQPSEMGWLETITWIWRSVLVLSR